MACHSLRTVPFSKQQPYLMSDLKENIKDPLQYQPCFYTPNIIVNTEPNYFQLSLRCRRTCTHCLRNTRLGLASLASLPDKAPEPGNIKGYVEIYHAVLRPYKWYGVLAWPGRHSNVPWVFFHQTGTLGLGYRLWGRGGCGTLWGL